MSAATNPLTDLLIEQAARLDVPIDATILAKLGRYQALLAEWGDKINLTALRDPTDVAVRHFLDSLALVRELPTPEELAQLGLPCTLVDVGSGAGFPGALCALCRPALRVTLVERIGKKAAFLQTLRRELGLHYEVAADDAEIVAACEAHGVRALLTGGSGAGGGVLLMGGSPGGDRRGGSGSRARGRRRRGRRSWA